MTTGFFIYIVSMNTLTYSLMWVDKVKSIYGWWRISERTLWILALIGGSLGIWLGMKNPLYHKAGKRSFQIWIPFIMVLWVLVFLGVVTL